MCVIVPLQLITLLHFCIYQYRSWFLFVIFRPRHLNCSVGFYWNHVDIIFSKFLFNVKVSNKYWLVVFHSSHHNISINLPFDNGYNFSKIFYIVFFWERFFQRLEDIYCVQCQQKIIDIYTYYTSLVLQTPDKDMRVFV